MKDFVENDDNPDEYDYNEDNRTDCFTNGINIIGI